MPTRYCKHYSGHLDNRRYFYYGSSSFDDSGFDDSGFDNVLGSSSFWNRLQMARSG